MNIVIKKDRALVSLAAESCNLKSPIPHHTTIVVILVDGNKKC